MIESDFCLITADTPIIQAGMSRSPHWEKVRGDFIKLHPFCAACGCKEDLEVHHIQVYHLNPQLELDLTNLLSLCKPHHLLVGHLMNWHSWNVNVVKDAELWLKKVKGRP